MLSLLPVDTPIALIKRRTATEHRLRQGTEINTISVTMKVVALHLVIAALAHLTLASPAPSTSQVDALSDLAVRLAHGEPIPEGVQLVDSSEFVSRSEALSKLSARDNYCGGQCEGECCCNYCYGWLCSLTCGVKAAWGECGPNIC
jgi:hypothetical protein